MKRPSPRALIVVALAIVAALVVLRRYPARMAPPAEVIRAEFNLPRSDQLASGPGTSLAVSPDGRQLAYVGVRNGVRSLFLRPMDHFAPDPVEGTSEASSPFFSGDGQAVGFLKDDGSISKVMFAAPTPTTVCGTNLKAPMGASWADDGSVVVGSGNSGLWRCGSNQSPESLTTLDASAGDTSHRWPDVLPGNRGVLLTVRTATASALAVLSLEDGHVVRLGIDGSQPHYVDTGHVVFSRGEDLWAVRFRLDTLRSEGAAGLLQEGVEAGSEGASQWSFSKNGRVFVYAGTLARGDELVGINRRDSQISSLTDARGSYRHPSMSPDGRYVTVARTDRLRGEDDIWVIDLRDGRPTRLTASGHNIQPSWSPDGRWVQFATNTGDGWTLNRAAVEAGAQIEPLLMRQESLPPGSNADFQQIASASGASHWVVPRNASLTIPESTACSPVLVISPGGRWLVSPDSGGELLIQAAEASPLKLIRIGQGAEPRWSADGSMLSYRKGEKFVTVPFDPDKGVVGRAEEFTGGSYVIDPCGHANFDVHGDQLVVIRHGAKPMTLGFIVDEFFERLRRTTPAN